jgi:transposase
MPWPEVRTLELRERFVKLILCDGHDKSELCREFGISRPTGYKWLSRYEEYPGPLRR